MPNDNKEEGAIGVISDLGDLVRDGEEQPQEEKDKTEEDVRPLHPDRDGDTK